MDWKDGLSDFRKRLNAHLRPKGFVRKGNCWDRAGIHWMHEFTVEVYRADGGRTRKVMIFPTLSRREPLDPGAAAKEGGAALADHDVVAHYSVSYSPVGTAIEHKISEPDELEPLVAILIKKLDDTWIPWFRSRDADDSSGAYRYLEYIKRS